METSETSVLDANLDAHRLGAYQVLIIALCGSAAMIDGFDTQSIALAAPAIASAWQAAPSAFGPVFGAGLFGGLAGAMMFGLAGDRFGRKPTLLVTVILFAVSCLVTPLARGLWELAAMRFVTGVGLGGALPSIISIASEYAPKRVRSTAVAVMFCGFPLGAALGGAIAAKLIPAFGWTSVFYAGGIVPLLLLPVYWAFLPESIQLLLRRNDIASVGRILAQLKWSTRPEELPMAAPRQAKSPLASLFREGRLAGTLLLAAAFFFSLLLTYFLINWIPLVSGAAGVRIEDAILGVAALNVGAIIGCIVLGQLADRSGPAIVIGIAYVLGAIATAAIGQAGQSGTVLLTAAFLAGFFSIGAQMCTVALCASFYETALRATGIGWSMGVGRLGAIAGPVLGGVLVGAGMSMPVLFAIAGLTSLGAAVAVLTLGRLTKRGSGPAPAGHFSR